MKKVLAYVLIFIVSFATGFGLQIVSNKIYEKIVIDNE